MKTFLLSLFVFLAGVSAFAQRESEREKIQEIEQARQAKQTANTRSVLDSAIALTDAGKYAEADEKYRFVLRNLKAIPSELTYHFGKNSYLLKKYSQSIDWLNKYIQLKGTSGQFYNEAVSWLKKAEDDLLKERQQQASQTSSVLSSRNYDIDCGPTGKVVCPVCNGSTVVIKKTYLGDSYKTCTYCKKLGYITCEEYNRLLRGE